MTLNKKHCNWHWCWALDERPLWILLFQHEEVQFLENELENQKQKYQELASFTKSLLSAVRNNDLERQQVTVMVAHGQDPFSHHLIEMSNLKSTVVFRSLWPFYLSLQTRIGTWTWREEPIPQPCQQTCHPTTTTPRRPGQAPWNLCQPCCMMK